MGRYLAIEFNAGAIKAGIFRKDGAEPVEYFQTPAGETPGEGLEALFTEINAKGYKKRIPVYLSISPEIVSTRILRFPFSDLKKIREAARFESQDLFLGEQDSLVFATMPLAGERTLVAAVDRASLNGYLEAMTRLGFEPEWIGLDLFMTDRLLYETHKGPEGAVLLDGGFVAAVWDRAPFDFMTVRDAVDVRLFLDALGEEGVEVKKYIATMDCMQLAEGLGLEWEFVSGYDGKGGLRALALHISEGAHPALDFRAEEVTLPWRSAKAGRSLKVQFALTALLLALTGSDAYLRARVASAQVARISSGLDRSYREMFPSERGGAYAYIIESKLKRLEKERDVLTSGVDLTGTLKAVSEGGGLNRVRIHNVNIFDGGINLGGEADSFEGAGNFRDALSKSAAFREIILTDVKSAPGGVRFGIVARLGAGPDGAVKSP